MEGERGMGGWRGSAVNASWKQVKRKKKKEERKRERERERERERYEIEFVILHDMLSQ